MQIIQWAPITNTEQIPPFGAALERHILGYRNPAVRRASCSAWSLLHRVLLENGLPYGTVAFAPGGKPRFTDCAVFFSLSHSGGICAVAVSDAPVGVDVELCRDRKPASRLIKRICSEAEIAAYDGDFTRLWCRKETAAKLTGDGLHSILDRIDTCDARFLFTEETVTCNGESYWLVAASEAKEPYHTR